MQDIISKERTDKLGIILKLIIIYIWFQYFLIGLVVFFVKLKFIFYKSFNLDFLVLKKFIVSLKNKFRNGCNALLRMFQGNTLKFKRFIWKFKILFFDCKRHFLDFLFFLIIFMDRKLHIEWTTSSSLNESLIRSDHLILVFFPLVRLFTWAYETDFIFFSERVNYSSFLYFMEVPNVSQLIWCINKNLPKENFPLMVI